MTEPIDALLTVVVPSSLEEQVLDHLLSHPQWSGAITTVAVEAQGGEIALQTPMEQVRGRARRRLLALPIPSASLDSVVASLHAEFRNTDLVYWVTPLTRCGRTF